MVQIYTNRNPDVSKNGIIIDPISCEINPKLNGENELEMECYLDKDGKYKYIQNNNYIAVPTPDFKEPQLYKIYNTKKSMSGDSITAYARHIEFNLAKSIIFNKNVQGNGQQVLTKLLEDTPFTGHSNINTADIRQYKLRSVMNVINGSEDDSFVNVWGGEISCNNYDLTINTARGSDKGIRVTFGYNLEDIEEELDFDGVITRLYPYSGDLVLSGSTPYVDSPLIKNIGVLEDKIEFSDIKVKDSSDDSSTANSDSSEIVFDTREEAEAEMIKRCEKMYDKGLDKITANYVIKMQDLSRTVEYKKLGYDVLEKICLGDTVHCYNKNIDIEVEARCISYKWDCINEEYIEIELGDFISNYINMQNDRMDNLYRKIVMTEQEILLEVDSLDNNLSAKIDITAGQIRSEVADKTNQLSSAITQTANEIRSEVTDGDNQLNSKIDQTASSITTTINNAKDNLQSQITQNADSIKSCVTKNQFGSYITQNADSVTEAIIDATGSHTCTFNSSGLIVQNGGLIVKDNNGNTIMQFKDGVAVVKDLDMRNGNACEKGSAFYNTLANMEEVSTPTLKVSNEFVCKASNIYISDFGGSLEEYIKHVVNNM
ncbi:phage tail spike protein [Clostridium sp. BL-8]|uniref:phage tail spike protein n=1 Tax=Clostridium sp. BL-8 TaxID=349938 RepID=UPI00098C3B2C|nr:phage tail spike protein [Clostridium sp. BL-8]OOM75504.1 hypothetical protein CLOBL_39940 [Clostridium sp. BL-8]